MRRVFKAPVVAINHPGKGRAGLVRIPANSDHCSHTLIDVDVEVIGAVMAGGDADFFEHFEREWMYLTLWFGTRTKYIEEVARGGA